MISAISCRCHHRCCKRVGLVELPVMDVRISWQTAAPSYRRSRQHLARSPLKTAFAFLTDSARWRKECLVSHKVKPLMRLMI